jgi:hypothetical protein
MLLSCFLQTGPGLVLLATMASATLLIGCAADGPQAGGEQPVTVITVTEGGDTNGLIPLSELLKEFPPPRGRSVEILEDTPQPPPR